MVQRQLLSLLRPGKGGGLCSKTTCNHLVSSQVWHPALFFVDPCSFLLSMAFRELKPGHFFLTELVWGRYLIVVLSWLFR